LGYDRANSANWYEGKMARAPLEDYPVLFWLRDALEESRAVFEIGGHVGTAYYGFERLLRYPPGLDWTIWDVPSIVSAGRALALERGRTSLSFSEDHDAAPDAEVLLAAGSLQYIPTPRLETIVASRRGRLRHILLNLTPVYDGPEFVTLQNIGNVLCPYRVFNRVGLIGTLDELGYKLVDEWQKPRPFRIKFNADRSFDAYSGFYFRAID
jgi:putative methyltransferase (TIGR04325 family)